MDARKQIKLIDNFEKSASMLAHILRLNIEASHIKRDELIAVWGYSNDIREFLDALRDGEFNE